MSHSQYGKTANKAEKYTYLISIYLFYQKITDTILWKGEGIANKGIRSVMKCTVLKSKAGQFSN